MKIIRLDACASTNLEAKRIAESGDLSPVWIQSDVQTGGIGRRGRPWVSQSGNLFCTGLYPYDGALRDAARLSFAAALAVVDTLDRYIAPAHTKIKWPNDLLISFLCFLQHLAISKWFSFPNGQDKQDNQVLVEYLYSFLLSALH